MGIVPTQMELDREQLGEGKITRPEVRRLQVGPAAFWLMTFNVLAPRFSSPDVYTWCAAEALCWSARWPRILAQLLQQSPDLLALQELQMEHIPELQAIMGAEYGIVSGFWERSEGDMGSKCGNALLYRKSVFGLSSQPVLLPLAAREVLNAE